jgi:hypothetical protein
MPANRTTPGQLFATLLISLLFSAPAPAPAEEPPGAGRGERPFRIEVVDEETGRGVPLVELRTVHQVRHVTDSNGIVAFDEPGLLGQKVFFFVKSHGYEFPKDGFGYSGVALETKPAGNARIKLKRINIARRLYRVTGGGIYRDSLLTGTPTPALEPVLNGQVLGQDSVLTALFQGKLHWFWGDTNRPGYPLGNFHVPGATSELPAKGGLDPARGVNLKYFLDRNGFARPTCELPGAGPTWITGLVVLMDRQGRERMFANYAKIRPPMETYQRGLVEWDPSSQTFQKRAEFALDLATYPGEPPGGHPIQRQEEGVEYIYYANPYPLIRVPADPEALKDPDAWQGWTCLAPGTRAADQKLDRGHDRELRYAWKKRTQIVSQEQQGKLIKAGLMKEDEALLQLRDVLTGKTVLAHGGSVFWNSYRGRWVMIAVEAFGSSFLGEVWHAEADTLLGPWVYARKVVTHDDYSFYNPKHHPMFDQENGRIIYFEGTYTATFSGTKDPTPRYDYNQVMYQLDLADPRLALPVAIYKVVRAGAPSRLATRTALTGEQQPHEIAFFAPDRPGIATAPVIERRDERGEQELITLPVGQSATAPAPERDGTTPIFYAVAAAEENPPAGTVPLYEFRNGGGLKPRRYYSVVEEPRPGYQRSAGPLGRVWGNPSRLRMW